MLEWREDGRTKAEIASLKKDFRQEVSIWHKLDHPNITKVLRQWLFVFAFRSSVYSQIFLSLFVINSFSLIFLMISILEPQRISTLPLLLLSIFLEEP